MIVNPILPGFNPDPSICRVGADYFIATSTFEWYPGVQIHHSTDMVHWKLVSRPLNRVAQLDMRGNPDSCGIWAPCLSFADRKFWLVYTDVKRLDGAFKDSHNYIVTCDEINGEWSDPVFVNSSGFDPSLFHDRDGKKWFLNMQWNHRGEGTGGNPANSSFDGILLQRWSESGGLTGAVHNIFAGSSLGLVEAPHLFWREGYYYLTTAEGGTGYDHAVTMARSKRITGPYQLHPNRHIMSHSNASDQRIQRTGHGQYVETPDGEFYHTFLMGRPITDGSGEGRFCPMGRETGIEKCVWKDGWLYLEHGGELVRETVPPVKGLKVAKSDAGLEPVSHNFRDGLPIEFQWLRTPHSERIFSTGPEGLTLIGRESLGSWFEQALVARRQTDFCYFAETTLATFNPDNYQQAAGLTTYYNRHKFHALVVSYEAGVGRVLSLISCNGDYPEGALEMPLVPRSRLVSGPVDLRVDVDHASQQFFYRQGGDWIAIGPPRDASLISDEAGRGEHASFTGAFIGMVAFDTSGKGCTAQFDRFLYNGSN
ncbi:MAG: glycoside hydrolase family 43 protein [Planktomarina sp.]|jgi:xylan 1,4-beta-xylosidase|nr:glycoside hydrolase family 43 protein [Planktomarina sp.]